MNKRARLARRILRDHRRNPRLRIHVAGWRESRPFGSLHWRCPRCSEPTLEETMIQQQWELGDAAIPRDRPLVSGQWRLKAMAQYLKEGQTEA